MAETNRQRVANDEPSLGYGLSLHIGNVMFGNVGLAERLSFSVFGSTVNEAARLETLTKKFATPIVASEEFATYCGRSEEHTSELQSLMRISYAVFCLKKNKKTHTSAI